LRQPKAVLIAGASGAAAAAVSMMAGTCLDVETTRDEAKAIRSSVSGSVASLSNRLAKVGLTVEQSEALTGAVQVNPKAVAGLLLALGGGSDTTQNPLEQALWMLVADFLAAAIPILPFVLLPIQQARIVSCAVTIALLIALGLGRAQIAKRSAIRTVAETVSIGVTTALADVAIGLAVDHSFG
jgi:VIT1/CCC1 family predicted Fe2+/Mn2+ transporter